MNWCAPDSWVQVDRPRFEDVLKQINYMRDGWADGIVYTIAHTSEQFAIEQNDGRILVDPEFLT